MAIWQYKLFSIPDEELRSYFNDINYLPIEAFDNIEWWKYRDYNLMNFSDFEELPFRKSWSNHIKQLGDVDSDCVETIMLEGKIIEISIRIDLRNNYPSMVECVGGFGYRNNLYFLNSELKLLPPVAEVINQDIKNFKLYNEFKM